MRKFSFISENTIENLSLHDCQCERIYLENGRLIFDMEWMEVLPSHPDNPYPEAHQSGRGRIELIDPESLSCEVVKKANIMESLADEAANLHIEQVEILDFIETKCETGFCLKIFGVFRPHKDCDFLSMNVAYSGSVVCFNELGDISWFEDRKLAGSEGE